MLDGINKAVEHDLTHNDGLMISVSYEEVKWLIKQAEMIQAIRKEAEDLYTDGIDMSDFGERVENII